MESQDPDQSADWVAKVICDKPVRRAASIALTTDWWLAWASALITKVISLEAILANTAESALTELPLIGVLFKLYWPRALTVKMICWGRSFCFFASATGRVRLISVKRDQVVVSIKKIITTNKMSMKGIKLISGSAEERFLLKFTINPHSATQMVQVATKLLARYFHVQQVIVHHGAEVTPEHQCGNGHNQAESGVV